jgi:hypothetical protein
MARPRYYVRVGQRFRALHKLGRVWEVDGLVEGGAGPAHARLHAVDDRTEVRTIACDVLLDRARFQPLPPQADAAQDPGDQSR